MAYCDFSGLDRPGLRGLSSGGYGTQSFKFRITIARRQVTGLETVSLSGSSRQVSVAGGNPDPVSA
jgi:hypothetical protein